MTAYSGSLVLLRIRQEASKEYITVGGMKATKFILNNQLIDITSKESGRWRTLLSSAGISSISIAGSGIFVDSIAEQMVRKYAFDHKYADFEITFGNGDSLKGSFIISTYERTGNMGEEENYSISLESSGAIIYTTKT